MVPGIREVIGSMGLFYQLIKWGIIEVITHWILTIDPNKPCPGHPRGSHGMSLVYLPIPIYRPIKINQSWIGKDTSHMDPQGFCWEDLYVHKFGKGALGKGFG